MNDQVHVEMVITAVLFFLRHLGVIEFDVWVPRWLVDSTEAL